MALRAPLSTVRSLGGKAKRYVLRYTRRSAGGPRGDITVSSAAAPYGRKLWRDPNIFRVPGAFALAPKARVSPVPAGAEATFRLPAENGFGIMQGGCTDGRFAYLVLEGRDDGGRCLLYKVDMDTWQVAAKSAPLPLDHGNDLAFNPRTGLLAAVHCYVHPNSISFIDPATLRIVETKEYYHSVYGITYSPDRDQYVLAIRGGRDFAVFDSRFQLLSYIKGVDTRFITQGIDCDVDYIYFLNSNENAIVCYDWSGRYLGVFSVQGCGAEAENIFHRGGEWYISYNLGSRSGGCVYRAGFDRELLRGRGYPSGPAT